ncbi:uncharacterized protein [Physcomitrium patens]|uniref:SAM domain-containing protein n=1 Tax=Physcomitrium patens TaxID=3218 RepID=A9SIE4_PHYPA|nr:protein bicaudal C homolog 1-B-like [Physcomitrium patens]PNR38091.1 hypothetical protein PHYPA_021202 [Physcomitrium patens]|eukprot:XP_024398497.1 protein bicaudal C homolog 1-B-like [Physcomitrella patens]
MDDQPQSKRRRRPSVRLGEIGYAAPYDASSLWVEAPRQRRKQVGAGKSPSAEVLSIGKGNSGKKAPRTRPLEQVAGDKVVMEEEWEVIEPIAASEDEQRFVTAVQKLVNAAGPGGSSTPVKEQQAKRHTGVLRKVNNKVRGKGPGGPRLGWRSSGKHEGIRSKPPLGADSPESRGDEEDDDEVDKEILPLQADDEAPFLAETSSDSDEPLGSGLKVEEDMPADDSENGASAGSEDGDAGANPNNHGDEIQGAIEDGPGQANGKGFSKMKQREGERRSGRQAASRDVEIRDSENRDMASADIVGRDKGVSSREIAGEPSGRFQAAAAVADGTTTITPSSSQRGLLSAGVSGWLQDLGLGKYSELFELNEVDTEVLPLLTMDDLREMGVDAVGARRKMFTAIQELGQIRGI